MIPVHKLYNAISVYLYKIPYCNYTLIAVQFECKAEDTPLTKGSEDMDEMTAAELNQYLENIAKLIEATAKDPESAAQIVRDSKVKA